MTGARNTVLARYVRRVLRRPWPWVLRYLLATVPAVVIAPLIALPLRSWFRLPLFTEALDIRSLDLLLEVFMHPPEGMPLGPWLLAALLLAVLAWIVVRLLMLWTEGGVLSSYAFPAALPWQQFARACTRRLGGFLVLALLGTGLTVVCVVATAGLAWMAQVVSRSLGAAIILIGLVVVGVVRVWLQMARACVVVLDEGRILHALREAWRTMLRRPLPLLALVVGALALRGFFAYVSSVLMTYVPLSRWLLSFVIQQPVQMLVVGVGLARRAGEVGFVQMASTQDTTDG